MNIAVFGLGYVGMVNIACLSKLGHHIHGCDIKPHKVNLINEGKSTILEPQVDDLIKAGSQQGKVIATTDSATCVTKTEMAVVCVGTPSNESGHVNLSFIANTASDIAKALRGSKRTYTIVFRSTIPPGTIEELILPVVREQLSDKDVFPNIVFMPEFLREGNAVADFFGGARTVVGIGADESGKKEVTAVFGFSDKMPMMFTNYRTAEFIKYVDNAYHATKVAFANEVYSLGARFGVDVPAANEIFLMDNILNVSARYLRPGAPYGGSCLPKDSRAIIQLADKAGINIPFFKGLQESNREHQRRFLEKVVSLGKEKILIHGLTFKQNTDDIRESPYLILMQDLIKQGFKVKVFDPNLNVMTLRIEFPSVVMHIEESLEHAIGWCDLVVNTRKDVHVITDLVKGKKAILDCFHPSKTAQSPENTHYLY